MKVSHSLRLVTALTLAAGFFLAGCSSDQKADTADHTHDHAEVHISDDWVKAADEGMTGAFASMENDTDKTLNITKVSSSVSTETQLHETVTKSDHSSMMQEVTDGFTLKSGETMLLEPGGNHIMLMNLEKPLLPGDEVTFTLHFDDESTQDFTAVVKEFEGANESYESHGKKH